MYERPATPDLRAVCFKEQTICGVRVYTTEDVRQAVEAVATRAIDLTTFPSTAFDLADAEAAFLAAAGGRDCLKVMLTPMEEMADA